MIEVNEALTRKVAALANLDLTDAEVREYTGQIAKVLAYVDNLQSVPCEEGLEPLTQILNPEGPYTPRPDEVPGDATGAERAETGFHAGAYRVPGVL